MRIELKRRILRQGVLAVALFVFLDAPETRAQPNVLFVNVDDLNGFPGDYYADLETPNIDRLAASGVSFRNAHSPVPTCNPSRTATLMGMHPETTGITLNSQYQFRTLSPLLADKASLPQHFKNSGYRIVGAGKLFHLPNDDAPYTDWDEYVLALAGADYDVPGGRPEPNGMTGLVQTDPDGVMSQISNGFDWGYFEYNDAPAYVDDTMSTPDYQRAAWAVTQIEDAPNQVQPLFVSVGFYRPHLPHYCPKRFFDLIPEPLSDVPYLASDLDDVADPMGERSTDADLAFASVRDGVDYENQHARAYVACVAFVDELLGMLLDAIDGSPEDWLAVLWGDHGFQLGEKDRWRKLTLWERGTRTTLVMAGPGLASGVEIDLAVSLLDLYPTLADYAGLEIPAHLEGESFRRFLDGPGFDTPIRLVLDQSGERYLAFKSRDWSYIVNTVSETEELYDRLVDPAEWWNVADDPANEPVKEWLVPEPSMHFGLCAGAAMAALMASAGHIARARAGARASHRAHVAQPARSARESRLRVSPRRANE